MKLYAIEVKGNITNNDWSIVTIWKSEDKANDVMKEYSANSTEKDCDLEYRIKIIDTDSDECIYDYDDYC